MPYLRSEQLIPGTLLNIDAFGLCVIIKASTINRMNWVEVLLVNGDIEYLNPNYVSEEELVARVS